MGCGCRGEKLPTKNLKAAADQANAPKKTAAVKANPFGPGFFWNGPSAKK